MSETFINQASIAVFVTRYNKLKYYFKRQVVPFRVEGPILSSKAYDSLRETGCIHLPFQRTL